GDGGAGEGGGFFVGEVFGDADEGGLVEGGGLAEDAVVVAGAEGGAVLLGRWGAFDPALGEDGADEVADFPAGDAGADFDDFAGGVGEGNGGEPGLGVVDALGEHQVAVVEG